MNLILSKQVTSRIPLWLSFSCNELKVFGEFATITKKIAELPDELVELIKHIINRVNSEFKDDLIIEVLQIFLSIFISILIFLIYEMKTLCLIMVSQKGIPEGEALDMLNSLFENKNIDKLTWSQILLALKPFILFSVMENTQIIRLIHDRLIDVKFGIFFKLIKMVLLLSLFYQNNRSLKKL